MSNKHRKRMVRIRMVMCVYIASYRMGMCVQHMRRIVVCVLSLHRRQQYIGPTLL